MKIYGLEELEQGSDYWLNLRAGKITCSNLYKLFTGGKGETRKKYLQELAYERFTGEFIPSFKSPDMQYGNDTEPEARLAYQILTGNPVEQIAYCEYSDYFGGSPDGLIWDDGILEIKCFKWSTMYEVYEPDYEIDKQYMYQIQGLMYILDRQWCDFFIYHPKLKSWLKRYGRNEDIIESIKIEVEKAENEIQNYINILRG